MFVNWDKREGWHVGNLDGRVYVIYVNCDEWGNASMINASYPNICTIKASFGLLISRKCVTSTSACKQ